MLYMYSSFSILTFYHITRKPVLLQYKVTFCYSHALYLFAKQSTLITKVPNPFDGGNPVGEHCRESNRESVKECY